MNNRLHEYTLLPDVKVYSKVVIKEDNSYVDMVLVLPNGKDFQIMPNYHIHKKPVLSMFKHHMRALIKKHSKDKE